MVRAAMCLAALAGVTVLSGCGGSGTSPGAIRRNPTPELRTMSDRPVDSANMFWSTWNENVRMAWSDFHRGALYDRPSSLTPMANGR